MAEPFSMNKFKELLAAFGDAQFDAGQYCNNIRTPSDSKSCDYAHERSAELRDALCEYVSLAQAVEAEREECARVAEGFLGDSMTDAELRCFPDVVACKGVARAIRARGGEEVK